MDGWISIIFYFKYELMFKVYSKNITGFLNCEILVRVKYNMIRLDTVEPKYMSDSRAHLA